MRHSEAGFSFPEIRHRGAAGSGEGEAVFDSAGNLLRRQPGAGGRWNTSQYGNVSSAGQWTKLATATFDNAFRTIQFEIAITQGYTGRGGMRAIVSLATSLNSGFQTIQLRCIASDKASSRLVAVRTKNYPTDGTNEVELWWQTDANWLNVVWSFSNLLVDGNCTFTPTPSGGGWVASPSAGTQYPAWSAWMADQLNLSSLTPNTMVASDANDNLVSLAASDARALIGAPAAQWSNRGDSLESSDPFGPARFTDWDKMGGARTWLGMGPFSASSQWHNVVDVRHRNGTGDGATGHGGELVWGFAGTPRLAFRARAADGTPDAWTEVWTKAEISDDNMARLDGDNQFTGQNTFYGDLRLLTNGLNLRSGAGGSGYGSGGWFATEYNASSEPYNGLAGAYSGPATRSSLGVHSNPNSLPSAGVSISSTSEGAAPVFDIIKASSLSFSTDVHTVNGTDVTMTKARAIIIDSATRRVNLPPASDHSIAIVQVLTAPTTKHRIYPQGSAVIYWHDFSGNSRATDSSGTETLRVPTGMYWFLSNGTNWTLMGPASNT